MILKTCHKTVLFDFQIKSIMPVMNGVGADLIKFIKSYPTGVDFDAKDVELIDFM